MKRGSLLIKYYKCSNDQGSKGCVVPIIYGYPALCPDPLVESGAAVLGGCMVDKASPKFKCKECGAEGSNVKRQRGELYMNGVVVNEEDASTPN